ncbi:hypothetical protein PIB30_093806 [Stylosanthes scabra]|uniref:Uncharacterized protein n=1 Tax=Stylosanthes scabra TaxID=79078 RepID=A0ABU6TWP0_9FABA|nr:hypothetical protein [Stylosanthes scabra]
MDQVRHLNLAIDYSMITLDTRWDPKAKRIYNPKAEAQEQSEPVVEDQPERVAEGQPEVLADGRSEPLVEQQQVEETVVGEVRCGAGEFGASSFSVCLWAIFVPLFNRAPDEGAFQALQTSLLWDSLVFVRTGNRSS